MLHTLANEMLSDAKNTQEHSIVERIAKLGKTSAKPLVIVVDSGTLYDYLAQGFQVNGLPVFRSADIAVGVLGKYIHNRLKYRPGLKCLIHAQ
jgi:hypothetical protein